MMPLAPAGGPRPDPIPSRAGWRTGMLALTGASVQETADGRDTDVRTLCRDSLRPDDAGAAGGLSLADGSARTAACAEQDLHAQPQAGQGHRAARGAFPD